MNNNTNTISEKDLILQLTNQLNSQLNISDNIPLFINNEVMNISYYLNYYKINNLISNNQLLLKFLGELNYNYEKEISDLFEIKTRNITNSLDTISNFYENLPINTQETFLTNFNSQFKNIFLNYILNEINTKNIIDHKEITIYISNLFSKINNIKLKFLSILDLKIIEFINNPLRFGIFNFTNIWKRK